MGFKWQLLQEVSLNKVQILCQVDSCINPVQSSSDFLLIRFQCVNNSSSQSWSEMEKRFSGWMGFTSVASNYFWCTIILIMVSNISHFSNFFFFFNFLSRLGSLLSKMRELADQCFYYEQECPLKSNLGLYWWRSF